MNDRIQKVKSRLLALGYIDNEWLAKYLEMLEANLNTKRDRKCTQEHHAIPVNSYWISDEPYNRQKALKLAKLDNINFNINLRYKDHLIIHSYLTLCTNLDEVQRRYEAQATLRKRNSRIGGSHSATTSKKHPVAFGNVAYHAKAQEKRKLKANIDKAHKVYKEKITCYGKDSSQANKARMRWKSAINEYKDFCSKKE